MTAKKKKKNNLPNWIKSKKFLIGAALVIAALAVIGFNSFAHSRPTIPTPCLGGVIKEGSRGSCVLAAQKALNYLCQQTPYLPEDNNWETSTSKTTSLMTKRTKGYQDTVPTTRDGIIGPTTWKSLNNRVTSKTVFAHTYDCRIR